MSDEPNKLSKSLFVMAGFSSVLGGSGNGSSACRSRYAVLDDGSQSVVVAQLYEELVRVALRVALDEILQVWQRAQQRRATLALAR